MFQSRFTVAGEMPSTSAVSSIVNPPKKRSSIIRLCCGSIAAKVMSASSNATSSKSRSCGVEMAARVIHKYATHHLRGDSEKLSAVLPVDGVLIDHSQVGFIDECSCLKSVALAFSAQITARNQMKLFVDKGHELIQCLLIALAPVDQQLSYVWW